MILAVAFGTSGGPHETGPNGKEGTGIEQPKDNPPPPDTNPAKNDLKSFQIDDRSQAGLTDIWVTWNITNHSSKMSDYSWDWEAVNSDGTRVADGTEYVPNVKPGQTTKGEDITTLETPNVEINVIDLHRTASAANY